MRTNSLSLFDELDASDADNDRLKTLLDPEDTLLTFRDFVVHLRQLDDSLDARRIAACLATTADRVNSMLQLTRRSG